MHLSNKLQGTLERQGLLLTTPGEYTAHLGPHSRITGRERQRERGRQRRRDGTEVLPYWYLGKGVSDSVGSRLVNLKHKSEKGKKARGQLVI